ncbi:unnamed protein product, partial [Prorocentrum cordatum]
WRRRQRLRGRRLPGGRGGGARGGLPRQRSQQPAGAAGGQRGPDLAATRPRRGARGPVHLGRSHELFREFRRGG